MSELATESTAIIPIRCCAKPNLLTFPWRRSWSNLSHCHWRTTIEQTPRSIEVTMSRRFDRRASVRWQMVWSKIREEQRLLSSHEFTSIPIRKNLWLSSFARSIREASNFCSILGAFYLSNLIEWGKGDMKMNGGAVSITLLFYLFHQIICWRMSSNLSKCFRESRTKVLIQFFFRFRLNQFTRPRFNPRFQSDFEKPPGSCLQTVRCILGPRQIPLLCLPPSGKS